MELSQKIGDLSSSLDDGLLKEIKNRIDVSSLINSLNSKEDFEKFGKLIFTAKYVNGLKKILSNRSITTDKYIEKIFDEFNSNVLKFTDDLKTIAAAFKAESKKMFEEKYFAQTQQSMINIMELMDDLTVCKEHLNR